MRAQPRSQPLAVAGSTALKHGLKLTPVDGAKPVVLRGLVPAQLRVRNREPEELRLRHSDVDELLAQLIVTEALDLPAHRLRRMLRVGVARAEHHDRRPPPAVQRILRHGALLRRAACQGQHDLEPLALMKTLFLADAHHGARIGPVRAAADGNLVHDRRAIDQPADRPHIGPGQRRVIEDARVFGGAGEQLLEHLLARDAECFRGAVQVHAVAAFILHLRDQHRLAAQRRGARDPVTLRQHADDFRVRVLRDLPDQSVPVGIGHPVLGLDLVVRIDARLETGLERRGVGEAHVQGFFAERIEALGIHAQPLANSGIRLSNVTQE